jgi:hypothetical protein
MVAARLASSVPLWAGASSHRPTAADKGPPQVPLRASTWVPNPARKRLPWSWCCTAGCHQHDNRSGVLVVVLQAGVANTGACLLARVVCSTSKSPTSHDLEA